MPLASHLPQPHTPTHTRHRRLSRDFAFSLAAEPSRHGPQQQCSDIHCSSLTLSAPGKERRARALVESHSLTCGGDDVQGISISSASVRTRSRGRPSGQRNVSDLAATNEHEKSKAVLFEQARDEREAKAPLPLVLPLNLHRHLPRRTAQPVVGGRR